MGVDRYGRTRPYTYAAYQTDSFSVRRKYTVSELQDVEKPKSIATPYSLYKTIQVKPRGPK